MITGPTPSAASWLCCKHMNVVCFSINNMSKPSQRVAKWNFHLQDPITALEAAHEVRLAEAEEVRLHNFEVIMPSHVWEATDWLASCHSCHGPS